MTRRYDFGDRATGVIVNENDWGSTGPTVIRPRRVVSGTVVGLYPQAPDVVKVKTPAGETVCIRIGRLETHVLLCSDANVRKGLPSGDDTDPCGSRGT